MFHFNFDFLTYHGYCPYNIVADLSDVAIDCEMAAGARHAQDGGCVEKGRRCSSGREEERTRYGDAGRNWSERQSAYSGYGRSQRTWRGNDDGPIIPREYAEDVDFVEVKEFSETKIGAESRTSSGRRRNRYEESQVSDAVWEMVKPGKRKK